MNRVQLFSDAELKGATIPPSKSITLTARTQSITVTNYSHLNLDVISSVGNGYGTLIPMSTQSFAVTPSELITFQPSASSINATEAPEEYVSYSESNLYYASELRPFAQLPIYAQNVNALIQNASLAVTGTVQANITNASLAVTGSVQANITNANLSVSGNVNSQSTVVNEYIATNSLVYAGGGSVTVSNLANGGTIGNVGGTGTLGLYDGVVLLVHSANGYKYSFTDNSGPYVVSQGGIGFTNGNNRQPMNPVQYSGSAGDGYSITLWTEPLPAVSYPVNITNNTGAAIVNDTLTLTWYFIKGTVNVTNPTSAPVYQQPSSGKFDYDVTYDNSVQISNTQGSFPMTTAGDYVREIHIQFNNAINTQAVNMGFTNGGTVIARYYIPGGAVVTDTINLGYGIPDSGIAVIGSIVPSTAGTIYVDVTFLAIKNSVAAPSVPYSH